MRHIPRTILPRRLRPLTSNVLQGQEGQVSVWIPRRCLRAKFNPALLLPGVRHQVPGGDAKRHALLKMLASQVRPMSASHAQKSRARVRRRVGEGRQRKGGSVVGEVARAVARLRSGRS